MLFKMDKVTSCLSLQALQLQEEHLLHTQIHTQRMAMRQLYDFQDG